MQQLLKPFSRARDFVRAIAIAGSLAISMGCAQAQMGTDLLARELIGATVYSADGTEVGEVASVLLGPAGDIDEIRMSAATSLGLGPRVVVLPTGSYMVLQAAVVLDLSQSEVDALPSATESEKRNSL